MLTTSIQSPAGMLSIKFRSGNLVCRCGIFRGIKISEMMLLPVFLYGRSPFLFAFVEINSLEACRRFY